MASDTPGQEASPEQPEPTPPQPASAPEPAPSAPAWATPPPPTQPSDTSIPGWGAQPPAAEPAAPQSATGWGAPAQPSGWGAPPQPSQAASGWGAAPAQPQPTTTWGTQPTEPGPAQPQTGWGTQPAQPQPAAPQPSATWGAPQTQPAPAPEPQPTGWDAAAPTEAVPPPQPSSTWGGTPPVNPQQPQGSWGTPAPQAGWGGGLPAQQGGWGQGSQPAPQPAPPTPAPQPQWASPPPGAPGWNGAPPPQGPAPQPGWGGPGQPQAGWGPGGPPGPAPSSGNGCLKGCLIVGALLVVLAIVGVIGITALGFKLASDVGVDPNSPTGFKECPIVSSSQLQPILGPDTEAHPLGGLVNGLVGGAFDKRVLPDAESCWVGAGGNADASPNPGASFDFGFVGGVGRIARYSGGDAASIFAKEKAGAENGKYFAIDVPNAGDQAFCTGWSDAYPATGALVRKGNDVVYVSFLIGGALFLDQTQTDAGVDYSPKACSDAVTIAELAFH